MDDDPGRVLQNGEIGRVGPGAARAIPFLGQGRQRLCAVAFQKGVGPVPRAPMALKTGQEEVVQDHHAGNVGQQLEHVLMKFRIAEMVQHPIEMVGMGAEPIDGPVRQMLGRPGIR